MDIDRLVLVYDADGGIAGELRYVAGKLTGAAHCALCDITHGLAGEKREWRECTRDLGLPVLALHRDELDEAQQAAAAGALPCVLAQLGDRYRVLIDPAELEACDGRVERLQRRLQRALARARS